MAAKNVGILAPDFARTREFGIEAQVIENILAERGVGPWGAEKGRFPRLYNNTLAVMQRFNQLIETLPKAAGIYEFKGEGSIEDIPADQRQWIRAKLGSPDFLAGGSAKKLHEQHPIVLQRADSGDDRRLGGGDRSEDAVWFLVATDHGPGPAEAVHARGALGRGRGSDVRRRRRRRRR